MFSQAPFNLVGLKFGGKRRLPILQKSSGVLTPVSPCHFAAVRMSCHTTVVSGRPVASCTSMHGSSVARTPQGRFTLLLGPPGSGKSTLLKALSNKLDRGALRVDGDITYNGHRCPAVLHRDSAMPPATCLPTALFCTLCKGGHLCYMARPFHNAPVHNAK